MKLVKLTGVVSATLLACSVMLSAHAADGDAAAGEKSFKNGCAMCHADLKDKATTGGKSAADLATDLQNIVAGKVTHPKKLSLKPETINNLAAYIAANDK